MPMTALVLAEVMVTCGLELNAPPLFAVIV